MKTHNAVAIFILTVVLSATSLYASEIRFTSATLDKTTFCTVNGQAVGFAEYNQAFSSEIKNKLYHGGASEERIKALRMEVAIKVISNTLLLFSLGSRRNGDCLED